MSKKTTNNDPRIERVKKMSDFKKTIQNATIDELKQVIPESIAIKLLNYFQDEKQLK